VKNRNEFYWGLFGVLAATAWLYVIVGAITFRGELRENGSGWYSLYHQSRVEFCLPFNSCGE